MLIKPENRKKVQDAIASGSVDKLFTPKNSRNLNAPIQTPNSPIIPVSFGNVAPLTGSDGNKIFTVMDALVEAKAQNKTLSSLKDADPYVLQKGGYYWTGEAILYPAPNEKFGPKLTYTDGNGVQFECDIPAQFQNLLGDNALKLMNGYFDDATPFFQFIQIAANHWKLQFNNVETLISDNLLKLVSIHRKYGQYLTDAQGVPNGQASKDKAARYFWQVDGGSYIGLLRRVGGGDWQYVNADRRPSDGGGVLAYG